MSIIPEGKIKYIAQVGVIGKMQIPLHCKALVAY